MDSLIERRRAVSEQMMCDAVYDATHKVLAEVGFPSLTMSRVAKEAGVSKGTLYNYYKDKDDLVLNAVDRLFKPAFEDIEQWFKGHEGRVESLCEILDKIFQDIEEQPELVCFMHDFGTSKVVKERLKFYKNKYHGLFYDFVVLAKKNGNFRNDDLDAGSVFRVLINSIDGFIHERLKDPEECPTIETDIYLIKNLIVKPLFKGEIK